MSSNYTDAELAMKIQALWRRYKVRKKLLETRKEFLAICQEIEEDFDQQLVYWPSPFCLPCFIERKKRTEPTSKESKHCSALQKSNVDIHSKNEKDGECYLNVTKNPSIAEKLTPCDSDISTDSKSEYNAEQFKLPNVVQASTPRDSDMTTASSNKDCFELASSRTVHPPSVVNCSSNEEIAEVECKDISCQTSVCFDDHVNSTPLKTNSQPVRCGDKENQDIFANSNASINMNNEDVESVNKVHVVKNLLTESWLSDKSFLTPSESIVSVDSKTSEELYILKEELTLELLWIGQAIVSRKAYLKLKSNAKK